MKKLKVNFTTIPNEAILDKRLDTYEFRVLCYLCKLSNEENRGARMRFPLSCIETYADCLQSALRVFCENIGLAKNFPMDR